MRDRVLRARQELRRLQQVHQGRRAKLEAIPKDHRQYEPVKTDVARAHWSVERANQRLVRLEGR